MNQPQRIVRNAVSNASSLSRCSTTPRATAVTTTTARRAQSADVFTSPIGVNLRFEFSIAKPLIQNLSLNLEKRMDCVELAPAFVAPYGHLSAGPTCPKFLATFGDSHFFS